MRGSAVTYEQPSETERALEARITALARELAETINAAPLKGRAQLRDDAVSTLRAEVESTEHAETPPAASGTSGAFNPFGIGIPLVFMGALLVFLFPPVGLLCFALAALMVLWGLGAIVFARG